MARVGAECCREGCLLSSDGLCTLSRIAGFRLRQGCAGRHARPDGGYALLGQREYAMNRHMWPRRSVSGWLCIGFALLLPGCSTPIKQGQDLSSSGIAYSDALANLADATALTVMDTSSRELLRIRKRQARDKRADTLDESDKAIGGYLVQIAELKSHVLEIRAYFINLQALSQSDAPEKSGAALKDVSEAINQANKTLRDSKRPIFTDVQLQATQKFGTLAVKGVLAQQVSQALERDKAIIGEQLLYEQRMMTELAGTLQRIYVQASDAFRRDKVRDPYTAAELAANAPDPVLGEEWVANRRTALTAQFQNDLLDKAAKASAHMQAIWADVVTGGSDPGSLRTLLTDVESLTAVMSSFDQAEKAKAKP